MIYVNHPKTIFETVSLEYEPTTNILADIKNGLAWFNFKSALLYKDHSI